MQRHGLVALASFLVGCGYTMEVWDRTIAMRPDTAHLWPGIANPATWELLARTKRFYFTIDDSKFAGTGPTGAAGRVYVTNGFFEAIKKGGRFEFIEGDGRGMDVTTEAAMTIVLGKPAWSCNEVEHEIAQLTGYDDPDAPRAVSFAATLTVPVTVTLIDGATNERYVLSLEGIGNAAGDASVCKDPLGSSAVYAAGSQLAEKLKPGTSMLPIDTALVRNDPQARASSMLAAGVDSLSFDDEANVDPAAWRGAYDLWTQALEWNPQSAGARANLASYYYVTGDLDKSIALLNEVVTLAKPSDADQWRVMRQAVERSKAERERSAALSQQARDAHDLSKLRLETSVLVVELKAAGDFPASAPPLLTKALLARLGEVPGLRIVTPEDIQMMLSLQKQKDLLGCDEVSCMAEIGGALGTEYVLYGQLGQLGTQYSLNITVLDTKAATVVTRQSWFTPATVDALALNLRNYAHEVMTKVIAARGH